MVQNRSKARGKLFTETTVGISPPLGQRGKGGVQLSHEDTRPVFHGCTNDKIVSVDSAGQAQAPSYTSL